MCVYESRMCGWVCVRECVCEKRVVMTGESKTKKYSCC
jgi:hypothetical protein